VGLFKKTVLCALALNSFVASAGTMGEACQPGDVSLPCATTAWDFGAHALYLKPVYGANLTYLGFEQSGSVRTWKDDQPDSGWGFKLEGSYHYDEGKDFNVNWYHYDNTSTITRSLTPGGVLPAVTARATITPKWDTINFEVGRLIKLASDTTIRLHYGAQYTRIDNDVAVRGPVYLDAATRFSAFGPRVGSDFEYQISNGFAFQAGGAFGILYAKQKFTETTRLPLPPFTQVGSVYMSEQTIEGNLGLKYNQVITSGVISIDAGFMWKHFDSPIHAINLVTQTIQECDENFNGIYFGFKWVGNAV
jgi:Legionella pneumophila major outer membrane protein precursor